MREVCSSSACHHQISTDCKMTREAFVLENTRVCVWNIKTAFRYQTRIDSSPVQRSLTHHDADGCDFVLLQILRSTWSRSRKPFWGRNLVLFFEPCELCRPPAAGSILMFCTRPCQDSSHPTRLEKSFCSAFSSRYSYDNLHQCFLQWSEVKQWSND